MWNQGEFINEDFLEEPTNVQMQPFQSANVLHEQSNYVKAIHDKLIFMKNKKGEMQLCSEITNS